MDKREICLELVVIFIFIAGGFLLGISFDSVKYVKELRKKDAEIQLLTETINKQEKTIQADEEFINNLIQYQSK